MFDCLVLFYLQVSVEDNVEELNKKYPLLGAVNRAANRKFRFENKPSSFYSVTSPQVYSVSPSNCPLSGCSWSRLANIPPRHEKESKRKESSLFLHGMVEWWSHELPYVERFEGQKEQTLSKSKLLSIASFSLQSTKTLLVS